MASSEGSSLNSGRIGIIEAVKSPLAFFTVVALLVEVILGLVAVRSEGINQTIIIGGMIFTLIWLVAAVTYFLWHQTTLEATKTRADIERMKSQLDDHAREVARLKAENEALRSQLEALNSVRLQILSVLSGEGSINLDGLLSRLRVAENDHIARGRVMAAAGKLFEDQIIERDTNRGGAYWQLMKKNSSTS
jgi:hypothetical protein